MAQAAVALGGRLPGSSARLWMPFRRRTSGAAGTATLPPWTTVFLFLAGSLAATIRLKFAGVQYLEFVYLLEIALLAVHFYHLGYRAYVLKPLLRLGLLYLVFIVGVLALSVAALRFDFYFLEPELDLLRRPVWITVARVVELFGNASMMLYLANSFRRTPAMTRFCMRVYFWAGMTSVGFALASIPIVRLTGLEYGAYLSSGVRLRGFYNEGGPFGLYLISLFLVGRALTQCGWEPRRRVFACYALVVAALLGAESKAALVAIFLLLLLNGFLAGSVRSRVAVVGAGVVFVIIALQVLDLGRALSLYQRSSDAYERASVQHRGDSNFVEGRIAGAFIVPRMIAAHPLTGIGWGNYGNLRNDPLYRGASAWSDFADDPGLGIYGSTADFGIPLQLLMLICLLTPFALLRRMRAPGYLQNLALLQPLVHLFGAQLNVTYGWVVTAFALGLAYTPHAHNGANVVPSRPIGLPGDGPDRA